MIDVKTMTDIDVFDYDVSEGFVIDNAAKADWAASVILNEQAQTEVFEQACDMMIDELRAKKAKRQEETQAKTAGLKQMLMAWMDTAPTKKAKNSESIKLPAGTIRRVCATQILEPDRDKLIEKYKDTDFVKVKKDFAWGEYKKNLNIADGQIVDTTTGEIISDDYITLIDVEPKIEVK